MLRLVVSFLFLFLFLVTLTVVINAQAVDTVEQKAFYKLTRAVPEAYLNGDAVKAAALAKELLAAAPAFALNWNYANALHTAHIVLGRIAADAGDLPEARLQLLASATKLLGNPEFLPVVKASPQLDSFGPDMTLAKVLLEKGDRDTVLKYFDACSQFWSHKENLDQWRSDVDAGLTPDFGPNLRYIVWKNDRP